MVGFYLNQCVMLLVKLIIIILLLAIIGSLFSGLFFLVKDDGSKKRTVNALTWRIGLSIVALLVIIIAGAAGLLQ